MYGGVGQEVVRPRIPESAGRPWVRSLLTQVLGRSDPVLEQHYTNSLRIGAMTFDEVQRDVTTRGYLALPSRAPAPAAPRAPARPRVRAPAPGPPPPGAVAAPEAPWWSTVPTWTWWVGGGTLAVVMLLSIGGGRR